MIALNIFLTILALAGCFAFAMSSGHHRNGYGRKR
jgi:hypothetical protein